MGCVLRRVPQRIVSETNGRVIWIINHYAGSRVHGMEYRHYSLARQFKDMGLRPVILCAAFHHLMTTLPESRTGDVDGIPYVWVRTCRYKSNNVRRVVNMLEFSLRLALKSTRRLPRPDVVIASSPHPFVAWNGYRLARKYGATFIFEVRDLWPLTLEEVGGHSRGHPFVRAMARAQRLGYERCDHTVSLLGGAKRYMVAHGLAEEKFVHIPNGVDLSQTNADFEVLPPEHQEVIRALRRSNKRIVLYAGQHGVVNALGNVVEAAALLEDGPPIHFLLVGQGPQKGALSERVRARGLDNVAMLPPVAKSQMPALTRAADLGYIGLQKKDLFRYGVSPNKLFEYMAAGLPVVFAIDTAFDEVSQAGCGFSIPAEDAEALAATLRQIAQMPAEELAAMGRRGYDYVRQTHTYDVLARQYAELF
jgi:glycosyltransferase involved in cell wall biosynthesis